MTVMICMQCKSPRANKYAKQTLTYYSRTDIVVAAICPEWFKLIETWVFESFDGSVS